MNGNARVASVLLHTVLSNASRDMFSNVKPKHTQTHET